MIIVTKYFSKEKKERAKEVGKGAALVAGGAATAGGTYLVGQGAKVKHGIIAHYRGITAKDQGVIREKLLEESKQHLRHCLGTYGGETIKFVGSGAAGELTGRGIGKIIGKRKQKKQEQDKKED